MLLTEYSLIKGELKTYIDLFHKQPQFLTSYLAVASGLITLAAALFSKPGVLSTFLLSQLPAPWPFQGRTVHMYRLLAFAAYTLLATVGMYFVAATLSYMYLIELLARRARVVEVEVNKLAGHELMLWEVSLSPRLIRAVNWRWVWISPSAVRLAWSFLVLAVVLAVEAVTAHDAMGPTFAGVFRCYLAIVVVFEGIQIVGQQRVGLPYVTRVIEHERASRELAQREAD